MCSGKHAAAIFIIGFAALTATKPSRAQDLIPLEEANSKGANLEYSLVRCAALISTFTFRAGEKVLGSEAVGQSLMSYVRLKSAYTLIRQKRAGGTISENGVMFDKELLPIAQLYANRFDANYAATGQVIGSDSVLSSDLSSCNALLTALTSP